MARLLRTPAKKEPSWIGMMEPETVTIRILTTEQAFFVFRQCLLVCETAVLSDLRRATLLGESATYSALVAEG